MIFTSSYSTKYLDMYPAQVDGLTSGYVPNGQWDVHRLHVERKVSQDYTEIDYYIHMKRKPMYHLFNIVIPCVMIMFCGMLVFLLPPDSGEKMSLAVTVLLTATVFQLIVADIMPPLSDQIPVLGK